MSVATTRRKELQERIFWHGRTLLDIFPNAADRDPLSLCRKLRRLEAKAAALALRLCNGPEFAEGEYERQTDGILSQVDELLGNTGADRVPIFINGDPRGYAIKIRDEWIRERLKLANATAATAHVAASLARLHKDWGGYGIIAPDLREGN